MNKRYTKSCTLLLYPVQIIAKYGSNSWDVAHLLLRIHPSSLHNSLRLCTDLFLRVSNTLPSPKTHTILPKNAKPQISVVYYGDCKKNLWEII